MTVEYQVHFASKEIWFDVSSKDDDLIDKLAFIHLLTMKFNGDELSARCFGKGKRRIFEFKVRFPDWDSCSNAQAHCSRNLTQDGAIIADYRGALDRADPGRRMAHSMKVRAETSGTPSTNN